MFSQVCVCSTFGGGGYPIPSLGRGVPHLRSEVGGYPGQVWGGGTLARSRCWGVPHLRSEVGGYPSQVWGGGGTLARSRCWGGTPSQVNWGEGVPWPSLDDVGGYPKYPPGPEMGYPPRHGTGYPPRHEMGLPPPLRQISIASTCYTAGGMPLAFTQEDFLVVLKITWAFI